MVITPFLLFKWLIKYFSTINLLYLPFVKSGQVCFLLKYYHSAQLLIMFLAFVLPIFTKKVILGNSVYRWVLGPKVSSFLPSYLYRIYSVQFSSVTQSCLTLCDPMNCSTPGLPVHHKLPEFTLHESTLHMRWPKYWSFNFSISPSNEHPALISFKMDLLDLLAVQGSFKSLLQHHRSKESIYWHSAFFTVQLSHP